MEINPPGRPGRRGRRPAASRQRRTLVIDALPEAAARYRDGHAIVAVDVFRATTSILTALVREHRVFPVPTVEAAHRTASTVPGAVLAGEQAGVQPDGFQLDNSPTEIELLPAGGAPIVIVTSAGTLLLANAFGAEAVYAACLRNLTATAAHLARHHSAVALIGAGARGEARPEDQVACAWIGDLLLEQGFEPGNARTAREILRWRGAGLDAVLSSPSADWLRGAHHEQDIAYVLEHIDDVPRVAAYDGREVLLLDESATMLPAVGA